MTSSDLWDRETAERYDETSAGMFHPAVLEPAIGTGRVAVPLRARGVPVSGIELS
jgi:hypothetical protein